MPTKVQRTIDVWVTSDGNEYATELEAAKAEILALFPESNYDDSYGDDDILSAIDANTDAWIEALRAYRSVKAQVAP